jgi:hypothetical protein
MEIKEYLSNNPGIIVGAIFLLIGIIVSFISLIRILQSLFAKSWSTTEGKITRSKIYISRSYSSSNTSSGATKQRTTSYRPDIEFEYRVQDQVYKSTRVYYGSKMGSSWKWRRSKKYVDKYPIGQSLTIFYKPSNYKKAVLEPGIHRELIFSILFGLLILYIGYTILSSLDLPSIG